jgi:hypothetical protein
MTWRALSAEPYGTADRSPSNVRDLAKRAAQDRLVGCQILLATSLTHILHSSRSVRVHSCGVLYSYLLCFVVYPYTIAS